MVITEKQYDPVLNPVLAEVQLGLDVASLTDLSDDPVAEGALKYTQTVKDAQATANSRNRSSWRSTSLRFEGGR